MITPRKIKSFCKNITVGARTVLVVKELIKKNNFHVNDEQTIGTIVGLCKWTNMSVIEIARAILEMHTIEMIERILTSL